MGSIFGLSRFWPVSVCALGCLFSFPLLAQPTTTPAAPPGDVAPSPSLVAGSSSSQPASLPRLSLPSLEELSQDKTADPTPEPRRETKSPWVALVLSGSAGALSYGGVALGAKIFQGGLTRGVTLSVMSLAGTVIGPSAGLLYAQAPTRRLWWPAGLRLVAASAMSFGLVLQESSDEGTEGARALLVGGGAALVGLGLFDVLRAPFVARSLALSPDPR